MLVYGQKLFIKLLYLIFGVFFWSLEEIYFVENSAVPH
jgi:hypothetical protein